MHAVKNTLGIICHFHTLAHCVWLQLSQAVVFKANENSKGMGGGEVLGVGNSFLKSREHL